MYIVDETLSLPTYKLSNQVYPAITQLHMFSLTCLENNSTPLIQLPQSNPILKI